MMKSREPKRKDEGGNDVPEGEGVYKNSHVFSGRPMLPLAFGENLIWICFVVFAWE